MKNRVSTVFFHADSEYNVYFSLKSMFASQNLEILPIFMIFSIGMALFKSIKFLANIKNVQGLV